MAQQIPNQFSFSNNVDDTQKRPIPSKVKLSTSSPSITAVFITCNEANVLETALKSVVGWVNEIIIIDMYSTDGTQEIANQYATKLLFHERLTYSEPIKTYSIQQATCDWVFVIDADEIVPDKLAKELLKIVANNQYDAVEIPFQQVFFGTTAQSGLGIDGYHTRLFRRGSIVWPSEVHGAPDISHLRVYRIPMGDLDLNMHHNTWRSSQIVLDKIIRYTPKEVEKLLANGEHFTFTRMMRKIIGMFIRRMFLQRGYEDGMVGLVTSLFWTFYTFATYAQFWEAEGRTKKYDKQVIKWGKRFRFLARTLPSKE